MANKPTEAAKRIAAKPAILSGGNPQIAKACGDAPVQAYIAAMRVQAEKTCGTSTSTRMTNSTKRRSPLG